MKKVLIAGNWKMHKLGAEARQFVSEFRPRVAGVEQVDMVLCPPFTCLSELKPLLAGSGIMLGAQNLFWEAQGAFTGEISAAMLSDAGCRYVIVGHSERRHIMGENNYHVNKKLAAALDGSLIPILCVGETLQEREKDLAMQVVEEQLRYALKGLTLAEEQLVAAYEPVWAIGTGVNASHGDAQQMCRFIRHCLAELYGREMAARVRILYGGSVKPENIGSFLREPDVDGALVGGASLQAATLAAIVKVGENVE